MARNDHGFGLIIECSSNTIIRRSEEVTAAMEDVAAPVLLAHELMSSLHLYAVALRREEVVPNYRTRCREIMMPQLSI